MSPNYRVPDLNNGNEVIRIPEADKKIATTPCKISCENDLSFQKNILIEFLHSSYTHIIIKCFYREKM